jgi:hypothetical protein
VESAVGENAVKVPQPRALKQETPRFERGAVLTGTGKAPSNRAGLGFRVWKLRVSKANREKLKTLYNDVINYLLGVASEPKRSKYLVYYADEWREMYENAKRKRGEAGKRTLPKTPPVLVPVRFVMPDGTMRGDRNAPAVIDLRKGELRIPSYGIAQKLRRSLVRALVEENSLEPRPDFVLQVTRRGFPRIVAHRRLRARLELPLRVVTIDENSRYGHSTATWYVSETKASMTHFEKLRPANHGYRREVAALLQSYADKPGEETKKKLAKNPPAGSAEDADDGESEGARRRSKGERGAAERQLR